MTDLNGEEAVGDDLPDPRPFPDLSCLRIEWRTEKMTPRRTNVRIKPLMIPRTGSRATLIRSEERDDATSSDAAAGDEDACLTPSLERLSFAPFSESLAESPLDEEEEEEEDDGG